MPRIGIHYHYGAVNIGHALHNLFYQFQGGPLSCVDAADVDDNSKTEVTDIIYLLRYLFLEDSAPEPPFPTCHPDPTPDELGCKSFESCEEP